MKICEQTEERLMEEGLLQRMELLFAKAEAIFERLEQLTEQMEQQSNKQLTIESEKHSVFITNQS